MIYQMTQDKGGASASRLAKQLCGFQSTDWNQLQKLRHAMGRRDESITLAGFIELDEAVIGPHARETGRRKKNDDDKKGPQRFLIGTYHGVSSKYLQLYLSEFAFRWNRRDSEETLWTSLLKAASFAAPMQYAELRL
jgi:hypothetical protein